MSGRGISDLKKPPRRFLVSRRSIAKRCKFEPLATSQAEDLLRANLLWKAEPKIPTAVYRRAAQCLARRLKAAREEGADVDTLASSVRMRELRINVTGALGGLMAEVGAKNVHAFTIIPRTWEFTSKKLLTVDPNDLVKRLLNALYRKGAKRSRGWLLGFIHGEWDPIGKVYRLHFHGLAYGGMVATIDRLRTLRNYKTKRYLEDGSLSPVYRRIRMTRKPTIWSARLLTCMTAALPPINENGHI